ncbi:beta strand repeat-containing protein, partial [Erythrobacter alti]|uniref:beta strand repeat-containing protein n=1 Tax=Erythrobacter alti TaxID=1896145 RepID=UPI0030F38A36
MSEELDGFDSSMMDAEGVGETAATKGPTKSASAQAPMQAAQVIPAGSDNTVVLPSGQTIDSLDFDGRDLVIILADGTRIVVPDGAIIVPQLVVDGTPIPPANVAALLVGNEPEPEAGLTPSSGGNFATDPGAIQSAFDLGDLLPYTELPQTARVEEEIIPDLIDDEDPQIVIETPDNPVGVSNAIATVLEEGLPARANPSEPEGTNAAGNGETTSGTIVFSSPDGLSAILINGVEITSIGQTFVSPVGTLTITSINLATGEIGFSYTLQDNTLAEEFDGFFEATVIDTDGDRASATLQIRVVDDGPIASDDVGVDPVGNHEPITGNVLDNDVSGADDYPTEGGVTGFSNASGNANPGGTLQGEYGTLTLDADGTYSYVRDVNTPGGVEETFNYSIVDQDGSTSSAVLTIEIADGPTLITFIPETGEGTVVNEAGLPVRNDETAGTGEIADNDPANNSDPSETTSATVTFNSVDGLDNVSINGIPIDPNNLPQTIISDATGTLVITAFTYDPVSGDGSITYVYTLADNTGGDDTSVSFEISVTDLDGDTASDTLTITIVDDAPIALDDSGMAGTDENAPITVDVFANDTAGADGVALDQIAFVDGSLQGGGSVTYNGDGTFTYTPAPGEEGQVSFDYSITDGDGDVATATVTITLADDSEPTIDVEGDDDVNESGLPARAGEPEGSNAASDSEIASGSIAITTGGDTLGSLTVNGQDVTGGGTVVTAKGVLEISVVGGAYSYSYTLTDNTLSDPDSDTFALVVTDSDGDTASTSLVIAIVDDSPSAEDDAAGLTAGEYGPVGGSVLANDTQGADGATVTSYSGTGGSGSAGTVVQGTYGTLTIAADGTFSYMRDAGTPGGVIDTFNYVITDGDGDQANADLVISIADSPTTLDLPTQGEDGTIVDEAGLDGPFPGSAAATDGEFTSGSFTFTAPDGPAIVTINGIVITTVGQTVNGVFGTLTIDSVANGEIGYTYELTTNTNGDTTADAFSVVVTDQDGDFSTDILEIAIIDDVPAAKPDSDSVTEDGPTIASGNVITGVDIAIPDANATDGVADVQGADGAVVTGVVAGTSAGPVSGDVGGSVAGTYGSITILADGSYIYSLNNSDPLVQGLDADDTLTDVFTYTLTDGDGDTSTTTVTLTINGADDPVVMTGFSLQGAEQTVDEDDLPDGSSPDNSALTQSGTFGVTSVDGLATLSIDGTSIFGAGVTYPVTIVGDYGTLTIIGVSTTMDAQGDVVAATVSYEFVLSANTDDHLLSGEDKVTDSFAVVATDTDGSTDTNSLDIDIIDDVPSATANENSVGEGASVGGNVLSDDDGFGVDSPGADGYAS